jgi:hypothetical protein
MITNPQDVRKAIVRIVLCGYDPIYCWESCCDHAVNFLVLSESEFIALKTRAKGGAVRFRRPSRRRDVNGYRASAAGSRLAFVVAASHRLAATTTRRLCAAG